MRANVNQMTDPPGSGPGTAWERKERPWPNLEKLDFEASGSADPLAESKKDHNFMGSVALSNLDGNFPADSLTQRSTGTWKHSLRIFGVTVTVTSGHFPTKSWIANRL